MDLYDFPSTNLMLSFTRLFFAVLVVTTNILSDLKNSVVLRELKSDGSLIQRNVKTLNIEFESIVYVPDLELLKTVVVKY